MPVVAQKIRSGLVELRTKSGLVYVNPSFSERLYLLWTFRNFHRLPVQVLNQRQRQVIERLGQTAVVAKSGPVPRKSLIGSVENFEVALASKTRAAAATGKVVSISAPLTLMGKAAGSEAIATQHRRFKLPHPPIHFPGKKRTSGIAAAEADVKTEASARKQRTRRFPQILLYQGSGKSLGIGLLVACCLTLLLWHSRGRRSISSKPVSQAAPEVLNSSSMGTISTYSAEPQKVQSRVAGQPGKATKTIAVDPVSSSPPADTPAPAELTKSVVSMAPLVTAAQADTLHRPYISEWPDGGFRYPIAPSGTLTGAVLLKAVIGINGTVTNVDILSGNRSLANAAARAVRHWRYPPHKVNGIPTEVETKVVIDFRGDDAVSISFPAM